MTTRWRRSLGLFRGDEGAAAAVEFALVFPVLLILAIGGSELTIALALYNKLHTVSNAVADIASRELHTSPQEMDGIERVARQFVEPYHVEDLTIVVSGISLDAQGRGSIVWSRALGGTAHTKGTVLELPPELGSSDPKFIVMAELSYTYHTVVDYGTLHTYPMQSIAYRYPRVGGKVECEAC